MLGGMVPCNVIAGEILSGHPNRYRAMLIETANPAHSLADSKQFIAAMAQLELSIVIDVNMTETARHADYVLPVATQYEKAEATFFNFEFPHNYFHLRKPVLAAPAEADVLIEAEIHARLIEAMGEMPEEVEGLKKTLRNQGRDAFREAFLDACEANPKIKRLKPVVLYRVLGEELPPGYEQAAALWDVAQFVADNEPDALLRSGLGGGACQLGEDLFDTMLERTHGFIFSSDDDHASWNRVRTPEHKIRAVD